MKQRKKNKMFSIYKKLNAGLNLLSIILVPALFIICAFWLVQPSIVDNVNSYNNILVLPGETTKIYSPVLINVKSKVKYELSLVNFNDDKIFYTYPDYYSNNLNVQGFDVKIPSNIKPDVYRLLAIITYSLNPIKNGTIKVELAHVTIVNSK